MKRAVHKKSRLKNFFVVFVFFVVGMGLLPHAFSQTDLSQREQEAYTTDDLSRIRRSAWSEAEAARLKGDYDLAISNLERILFFFPNDPEATAQIDRLKQEKIQAVAPDQKQELHRLVSDAQRALQSHDLKPLPELYQKIKALHETEPVLAQMEERLNNYQAKTQFSEEKERLLEQWTKEGERQLRESRWTDARHNFDKVLQLDPQNEKALKGLDAAHQALQREQEEHIKAQAKSVEAVEQKAAPQVTLPLPPPPADSKSAPVVQAPVDSRPEVQEKEKQQDRISSLMEQGKKLYKQKKYEEAIKVFEGVFEFSPENKEASRWIDKAKKDLIKSKTEMFDEKKTELDKAVKAQIDDTIDRAKKMIEQGRLSEAQVELDRVQVADPDNRQIKLLNAFLKDKQSEREAIAKESETLTDKSQLVDRAQAEFRRGNLAGARLLMEKVVSLDPNDQKAKNSLLYLDQKIAQELVGLRSSNPPIEKVAAAPVKQEAPLVTPEQNNYLKDLEFEYEALRSAQQSADTLRKDLKEHYQKPAPVVAQPVKVEKPIEAPPVQVEKPVVVQETAPQAETSSEDAKYQAFLASKKQIESQKTPAPESVSPQMEAMQNAALEMQDDYLALMKEQKKLTTQPKPKVEPRVEVKPVAVPEIVPSKEALIQQAISCYRGGQLEKAKSIFETVLQQDPTDRKAAKSIELINQRLSRQTPAI